MKSKKLLYDLFRAYYDARRNKRSTVSALAFEVNYEQNLFELHQEIVARRYIIQPSICFIAKKPVLREVFAAGFRDRVVHHLVYNYISPFFERLFINDSYSCRKGKGTSYGIKRADHFIRSCSRNYQQNCHILKLDISGYFMSIDRSLLYSKVEKVVRRYQDEAVFDVSLILYLIRSIIFHDPTKGCVIKGDRKDWIRLPKSKSLFFAGKNKGLPIGNLTSQLFGNVYLNDFDHFMKYKLKCCYYGRYVDDFFVVYHDKNFLKDLIPAVAEYLCDKLSLRLHERKIYLQHCRQGMPFLGVVIKPYRIYVGNKTKGGFYRCVQRWNQRLIQSAGNLSKEEVEKMVAGMNSYLGALKHYRTYRLRRKMLTEALAPGWRRYVLLNTADITAEFVKIRRLYTPYSQK